MNITELLELLNQTTECVKEKGFWSERDNLEKGIHRPLILIAELALCMTELNEALAAFSNVYDSDNPYGKDTAASEFAGFFIRVHETLTRRELGASEIFTDAYKCFLAEYVPDVTIDSASDYTIRTILVMLEAVEYARKLDFYNVKRLLKEALVNIFFAFESMCADPGLAVKAELERNTKREHLHGKKA